MTHIALLGDIVDINSESVGKGYTFDEIRYLDTSSVTENNFSELQDFKLTDAPSRAKRIVRNGDIVYSTVRPKLKHFGYIKNPAENTVASTGFAVIRAKGSADSRYLYYWLTAEERTEYLTSIADSQASTFPAFNPSVLEKMSIALPDPRTQKQVADILGTIDEKIELNRQMNETLEQMGQALFRHYFVNNPGADAWADGLVSDLLAIYSGYAFKRIDFDPEGEYGLVTIKNVQDGNFLPECSDHLSKIPSNIPDYIFLNTGDILLSLTGNVGRVCVALGEKLLLNQRVAKLVGIGNKQSIAYFMFRQEEFKNKLISMSRGTAQLNLSPVETKGIKMKLPPQNILDQYCSQAEPLLEKLTANNVEIQTLTTLRDTLLPRLISGKVRV